MISKKLLFSSLLLIKNKEDREGPFNLEERESASFLEWETPRRKKDKSPLGRR